MVPKRGARADPQIVIEGMEEILERDLAKHEGTVENAQRELEAYREGRAYEVRKKKHYRSLVNAGKYDQKAMESAIEQIDINLRHMADKVKLSKERIAHHQEIVDKLKEELANQYRGLKHLEEQRKDGTAD